MKYLFLASMLSQASYAYEFRTTISATNGAFAGTTGDMLKAVEQDALQKMIDSCGSLAKIKEVEKMEISLVSSMPPSVNNAGNVGDDLFLFLGYPPATIKAVIICKE